MRESEREGRLMRVGIGRIFVWLQKCAGVNFSNWSVMPKTWIVFGGMAVFALWNLSGVVKYSVDRGIRCTPWIFPHYFSVPVMELLYGFLTIALFSDAPFESRFSNFLKIRTGRQIWILGQCLFIAEASFCYSLIYFLLSVLVVLPRIIVVGRWGKVIENLALDPRASEYLTGIWFVEEIIKKYSPIEATLLTILLVFLVSCFLGMIIFMFRILFGGHAGSAVAGAFVFLSYFCVFVGSMVFGSRIYRLSPVSWITLSVFRGGEYPSLMYSFIFLVVGIVVCAVVGCLAYIKREGGGLSG